MKLKKSQVGVAVLVVMLASVSVLYGCSSSTQQKATVKAPRMQMQVVVQPVTKTDIAGGQSFVGAINPSAVTNLASKVNGKVTDVMVTVGTRVKKGQPLAKIDTSQLQQQLEQQQSSLNVSQAQFKKTQDDQANSVISAQKSADLQQAQYNKTVSDQQNSLASAKQQVTMSQAQLNKALKDQQNSVASAKQAVAMAQLQLEKARGDAATAVTGAQGAVDSAQSGLQNAQTNYNNNIANLQLAVQQAESSYQSALAAYNSALAAGNDTSMLYGSMQSAQSKLQQAQLQLQQAQSSQSSVASAQAQLTAAQQQLTNAENSPSVQIAQQQYNQSLLSLATATTASQETTQQQLNQAQLSLANAQSSAQNTLATAQAQLAQSQQSLKTAQSSDGLAVGQASLQQAMTSYRILTEQLQDGVLISPVDGIVTGITSPVGQMAGSSVMSVAATDPLLATVNVPETEVSKIKVGTAMDVTVSTLGKTFTGKVYAIHPTLDATTKSYGVDIKVDDPNHELLPGMFATATLKSAGRSGIQVPADTVISEASGNYVYVEKDNRVHKVQVTLGTITSTQFEITKGLNVGDNIVVKGEELLSDSVPVEVVTADQYGKNQGGNGRNGAGGFGGGAGGFGGGAGGFGGGSGGSGGRSGSGSKGGGGN